MNNFYFKSLDIETVNIIANWVYPDTGEGIYMAPYQDSYLVSPDNLKGPGYCEGYGVYVNSELFGIFEYTFPGSKMEIGCAISPLYKGKSYGASFVKAGIKFGIFKYNYTGQKILLDVEVSNKSAIKVYEKVGFLVDKRDEQTIRMYLNL